MKKLIKRIIKMFQKVSIHDLEPEQRGRILAVKYATEKWRV